MHSLPFCLLLSGLSCLNLWICFVLLVHGRAVLHMFCKLRVFLNAYRADVLFTFFFCCFLTCLDWLHLWIWQLSWALTTSIPSILFVLFVRGLFCTCVTNCISFCLSPGFLFVWRPENYCTKDIWQKARSIDVLTGTKGFDTMCMQNCQILRKFSG